MVIAVMLAILAFAFGLAFAGKHQPVQQLEIPHAWTMEVRRLSITMAAYGYICRESGKKWMQCEAELIARMDIVDGKTQ